LRHAALSPQDVSGGKHGRPHLISVSQDACQFEAVIMPHRSLSPRALWVLTGVIAILCCVTTAMAAWKGAWPVAGFATIELLLAAFLMRLNVRAAREAELVLLTESGLRIVRTDARGARYEVAVPAQWLRVRLVERPGQVPQLTLAARGVSEEIARCLGEGEKRHLAAALDVALDRWRNPRFDNPQLRDEAEPTPARPGSST
jgi:uncharacterized membrane protein